MVQIAALAQSIEDELNGSLNAVALGIQFKIHSTVGNYKKAITKANGKKQVYINGILIDTDLTESIFNISVYEGATDVSFSFKSVNLKIP